MLCHLAELLLCHLVERKEGDSSVTKHVDNVIANAHSEDLRGLSLCQGTFSNSYPLLHSLLGNVLSNWKKRIVIVFGNLHQQDGLVVDGSLGNFPICELFLANEDLKQWTS